MKGDKKRIVKRFGWKEGDIQITSPPKKKSALDVLSKVKGR